MSYDTDNEFEARLKAGIRKVTTINPESIVESAVLDPVREFPLVFRPALADVDLQAWADNNPVLIETLLLKHGAILFRGFETNSLARFAQFVRSFGPQLIPYNEPTTPRSELIPGIYTSTEYSASQSIQLHNELSYASEWPLRIWFGCLVAPKQGGETPIADCRRVFRSLSAEIRERFIHKGLMYIRNYGEGLGQTWQKVFHTHDKRVVERRCRKTGMSFEWKANGSLRTRQLSEICVRHPKTGDLVWFNQAHVHHLSSLDPSLRESLLAVSEIKDYPLDINACYGDGSAIEDTVVEQIRDAYQQSSLSFRWQVGDILMLDNILMAHGRAPYVGSRQIVVAMAQPYSSKAGEGKQGGT